jgi:hypothetical protein
MNQPVGGVARGLGNDRTPEGARADLPQPTGRRASAWAGIVRLVVAVPTRGFAEVLGDEDRVGAGHLAHQPHGASGDAVSATHRASDPPT